MPEVLSQVQAVRGSKVLDIHALVQKWDLFYGANHSTIEDVFELFKERFVRQGHEFAIQSFVYRNKIKPIVQKRAESIPTWFDFNVSEDVPNAQAVQEWLEGWLDGPFFGEGRNLWQALQTWNLWLERQGNLILKLAREGDQVYVSRVDVRNADVFVDPEDVTKVYAWEFTWYLAGVTSGAGKRAMTIREYVDSQVFRRFVDEELQVETQHELGFVPVVHVAVDVGEDGIWGRSVIEDLIEPQLQLAAAMSTIRECNRWLGWPAFAGRVDPAMVDLRPGGYTLDDQGDFRPLTWQVVPESLYREKDEYLSDLYEKGRVAQKSPDAITATGNLPSGKALLVLTQDGIQYIEGVVSVLEESMAELLHKAAALARLLEYNPDSNPIQVTYPPLRLEDDQVRLGKGKLLIEAYARGLLPKRVVVEALMNLDIFDVPEDVDEILTMLEAEGEPSAGAGALGGFFGEM